MSINSVFSTSSQGIQNGLVQLSQTAHAIQKNMLIAANKVSEDVVSMTTAVVPANVAANSRSTNLRSFNQHLINLNIEKYNIQANTQLIKTADSLLGMLIDIHV